MAAVFTSMQQHPACCSACAAETTSAHFSAIVDTVILAVSIFVFRLPGGLLAGN